MSERLARHGKVGAEEVTDAIGTVLRRAARVAYGDGGSLLKFGGDALLLLFTGDDHARAGGAGRVGMRRTLRRDRRLDTTRRAVVLRMSVGVHTRRRSTSSSSATRTASCSSPGPAASTRVDMEGAASAGEIVVSPATAARRCRATWSASRKGAGFRLAARAGAGARPRTTAAGGRHAASTSPSVVPARDPRAPARRGGEPEHRRRRSRSSTSTAPTRCSSDEGPTALADALDELVGDVQAAADEHGVTFLGTDIDHDGGKIILVAGAPRAIGDDEERMLLDAPRRSSTRSAASGAHRREPRARLRRRRRPAVPPHLHGDGRHREPRRAADGQGRARADPGDGRRARPLAARVRDRRARAVHA